MSLIIGTQISHAYEGHQVLRNVSFRVGPEDRIAVIGPNGEGKSTLLRILCRELESTGGKLQWASNVRMGYLPQTPPAADDTTIYECMLQAVEELRAMERELHEAAEQVSASGDDDRVLRRYASLQSQFEAMGGYDFSLRIEQVLTGLAFPKEMWQRPLSQLSGGQRTRAYLGSLLVRQCDVLALDEPTNHLDMASVEWLENYLKSFGGALLVVSHDRYFLDNVTTQTWEVAFTDLEQYPGSYSHYVVERDRRHLEQMRRWEAQQQYIRETQEFIARHLAGQRTKEAQGRRTRLERYMRDEAIPRPPHHQRIHVSLPSPMRTGDVVLAASDLLVGYAAGTPIASARALDIQRGDRVAIVGANGSGKTTLLKALQGDLDVLGGTVRWGSKVLVGTLSQTHSELDEQATAVEAVMSAGAGCSELQARNILGTMLLSGDDAFKLTCELSGGQRSRVLLARLAVQQANVLLLDEPTNHLDIASTEVMQEALRTFEGTIVFVSHDRWLIQALATQIWEVRDGQVNAIPGNWDDYQLWRQRRQEDTGRGRPASTMDNGSGAKVRHAEARKRANLLQRLEKRHGELEQQIEDAESKLSELNEHISLAGQAGDVAEVERTGQAYVEQQGLLKTLWAEYEQVHEQLEDLT